MLGGFKQVATKRGLRKTTPAESPKQHAQCSHDQELPPELRFVVPGVVKLFPVTIAMLHSFVTLGDLFHRLRSLLFQIQNPLLGRIDTGKSSGATVAKHKLFVCNQTIFIGEEHEFLRR